MDKVIYTINFEVMEDDNNTLINGLFSLRKSLNNINKYNFISALKYFTEIVESEKELLMEGVCIK